VTVDDLQEKWAQRDHLYSVRGSRLDCAETDAVREWRFSEAREVAGSARSFALGMVAMWEPPRLKRRVDTW
jgi:hypothetical protein